jgi:membrane-associated phospholipid phosphatase
MTPQDRSPGRNPRAVFFFGTGAVVVLAGLFIAIAEDVATGDPIVRLDQAIALWLHQHGHPALTTFLLGVTNLHSPAGVFAMSVVFAAYLAWKRARYWLVTLVLVMAGGMLLNTIFKQAFQRARPTWDNPLLTLTSYGFPSGHTAGATLFYGMLAAYLMTRVRSMAARVACVAGAVLMVALVGISRMYLGVHYLSDVLAAACASAAWLALCLLVVHHFNRRRAA